MGFLKKDKKEKKEEPAPPMPVEPTNTFDVAMHNTTTLTADEKDEFCHALFQSENEMSPAVWQSLAEYARNGARFVVSVFPGEEKKDEEKKD